MNRRKTIALLGAVAIASMVAPPTGAQETDPYAPVTDGPVIDAPRFREVGRVPMPTKPFPELKNGLSVDPRTGYMIINPGSRRGYTLSQGTAEFGEPTTIATYIQSFDLDTLELRRRYVVPNTYIPTEGVGTPGDTLYAGGIVHAVDPVARRIYLPMTGVRNNGNGAATGVDGQRPVGHVLVIDEDAFDRDPAGAFGAFSYPVSQTHLAAHSLMGLTVSRHHVAPGRPGKLVAVLASPWPADTTALISSAPLPAGVVYDHYLAQWDPADVVLGQAPPTYVSVPPAVRDDWGAPFPLVPCASATMSSGPHETAPDTFNAKSVEWEPLATREAVFVGCQSARGSGAVVRVPLDPRTGVVAANPLTGLDVVPLGKPVADVTVDEGGEQLLVKSFGGGMTWWVFNAAEMRFTGSVAVHVKDAEPNAVGVDPGTGRLYTLTPHTCVDRAGGGLDGEAKLPIRGGLKVADTRLDPVPAAENVVPELAYNAWWHIQVDPVTRRVFVRRGHEGAQFQDTQQCARNGQPAPRELFYRVYEDRIPVASRPGGLDDSTLTTDVEEEAGRTEASYLGSGSGYGSRSLLIGGADALARGAPTRAQSPCGSDDREALAGSVGKVEVSDQSTVAEAAALDADAGTQQAAGDPLSRCRPQAKPEQVGEANADTFNKCYADVREGAFDQSTGKDENKDGCADRDGDNRYAARCLGTGEGTDPGFDDGRQTNRARDGFEAKATCDQKGEKAAASATGSLSSADQPEVKVARSTSTVNVVRKAGKGVTVKVDSIARGVELPGVGTIGVVRAEATSTSTGRDGRASASFTRTVCDVDVGALRVPGCVGDAQLALLVEQLNKAVSGRARFRLRRPDPDLAAGTPRGYLAGVQRDRKDLFYDQAITKDRSLAVPALEVMLFQGDGGAWGAGRQIVQLAGAQASTSYGIVCTWGRTADGSCAKEGEQSVAFAGLPTVDGADPSVTTITETLPGGTAAGITGSPKENIVTRLLRAVPRAIAEALRLLFNNPRELGLLAALWALLYAPCYLGDRRRAVRAVAARRLT